MSQSNLSPRSSQTSSDNDPEVVEEVINCLQHLLRRNIFKETKRFARCQPEILEAILKTSNPTDPLFLETEEDVEVQETSRKPDNIENYSDDRPRWGIGTFTVVTAIASIGPGIHPLLLLLVLRYYFWFSTCSATFSIFPWEAIKSDIGLVFIVPVIVGWIFIALPIVALEQALGQMMKSGPVVSHIGTSFGTLNDWLILIQKVFAMINPRLIGLGISSILLLFFYAPSESRKFDYSRFTVPSSSLFSIWSTSLIFLRWESSKFASLGYQSGNCSGVQSIQQSTYVLCLEKLSSRPGDEGLCPIVIESGMKYCSTLYTRLTNSDVLLPLKPLSSPSIVIATVIILIFSF